MHHAQECYDLTESVLERDPYALECLPEHLASAVELRKKNELFMRGHMCAEWPQPDSCNLNSMLFSNTFQDSFSRVLVESTKYPEPDRQVVALSCTLLCLNQEGLPATPAASFAVRFAVH